MTTERIWILGAADPEMEAIECLLREAGERIIHALGPDGQRVRADSAYRAAALSEPVPAGATVFRVECGGPAIPADAIVIDHHRPGDPGYGLPPEEFMPASSIGQVIVQLARLGLLPLGHVDDWPAIRSVRYDGVERCVTDTGAIRLTPGWHSRNAHWARVTNVYRRGPAWWRLVVDLVAYQVPQSILLCAAADHCLAAAYRGECPGVDPDALMRWRAESRARFQRRPVEAVLADVERARAALREAPVVSLAEGTHARDLRGPAIPELPEAAAREGECFLASLRERDGKTKVVCQSGTPSQIEAFMRWAPANGLTGIYGDPARGFAGGYAERGAEMCDGILEA